MPDRRHPIKLSHPATTPAQAGPPTVAVRPSDLQPGDIIEARSERYEVVGRPFVGQTGSSVFDRVTVFWRVRLQSLDDSDGTPRYGTWLAEDELVVIRQSVLRTRISADPD